MTNVDLMLGDEVISCRGASSDAASPAGVVPGVAESGGSVEIECFFDTDQVAGECAGMQMMPRFANGEHELGARITTSDGTMRGSLASQMITLNNSNYLMVEHSAGGGRVLKQGMPMYGGPTAEGNMNAFHACPVAFDGTMIGKMSLRALSTGAAKAAPHQAATSLSFMAPTATANFRGAAVDMEGPFTWHANSAWNGAVEDEGPGGREHWVFAGEKLENADGLDVRAEFGAVDRDPDGPYYFDFKAPTAGPIHINKAAVAAGTHYSAAAGVALTGMADAGSGANPASVSIAVGDCSNAANLYNAATKTPNRKTTPFAAAYTGVTSVSALAEEDAARAGSGQTDDNGHDCYVAELTALHDHLGNAWNGDEAGTTPAQWKQTANFGVDKTAAVLTDMEPESGHVFRELPEMEFEVDNPDLASGDDGTPITGTVTRTVGRNQVAVGTVMLDGRNGMVTLDGKNAYFAKNGAKTVNVTVTDGAVPANSARYSLSFGYDTEMPTLSISRSQSDIGQTGASSVTVSVAGSVSDASEIESAALRLLLGSNAETCATHNDTLPDNRLTGGDKRNLENGTKSVAFDESFVIKRPEGPGTGAETYCFRLDVEDVAVEADARGKGNEAVFNPGSFTVDWPSTPGPTPGPTFKFQTADDNSSPTTFTDADSLQVAEGIAATDAMGYWVRWHKPEGATATAPTAAAAVEVTISAPAGVTVSPTSLTLESATDSALVTVAVAHDLDLMSELHMLNHTAKDHDEAMFRLRVLDDDFSLSASVASVTEDADSATVVITATAGTAPTADAGTTLSVSAAPIGGAVAGDFRVTSSGANDDIVIAKGKLSAVDTVYVTAIDDTEMDEAASEAIEFSVSGQTDPSGSYVMPASITIVDVDPDISVSLSHSSLDEGSGATVVTVTATLPTGVTAAEIMTFTIGAGSGCTNAEWAEDTFTINTRGSSGSGTVTVTPSADFNGDDEDCDVGVTVALYSGQGQRH